MADDILALQEEMRALQARLSEARRSRPPEPVDDYALVGAEGPVSLSGLFGENDDLIVVHNMGRGCAYCTLWADGFVGLIDHLEDRAAFVVVSPDDPATQAEFAKSRGWPFKMVSDAGGDFTRAMGFLQEHEGRDDWWPGMSAFHRNADGSIERTGSDFFGPGDPYNAPWHMFDHLVGGSEGWFPRFEYGE